MLAIARHAKTEDPVDQRGKDIPLPWTSRAVRINGGLLHAAKEIEQPDDDHRAGIFKKGDDRVDQPGNNQLERLGEDHQPLRFPVTQRGDSAASYCPLGSA